MRLVDGFYQYSGNQAWKTATVLSYLWGSSPIRENFFVYGLIFLDFGEHVKMNLTNILVK